MSINTEDDAGPGGAADFLRPLQRQSRTRTEAVIGELSEVARLSRTAALKRAAADGLAWETLVAMARAYKRAGDGAAARHVLDALIRRVSRRIAAKVAAWDFLTPEERADAKQEMALAVLKGALDTGPGQEFWECNFAHCFNRRLLDMWNKAMRRRGREVSLTQAGDDGEDYDGLDQVADPFDAFAAVEDGAFMARLARSHPNIARMLHLRMNGFTDREVAARLGVSDRTLRNRARTAQALWNKDKT